MLTIKRKHLGLTPFELLRFKGPQIYRATRLATNAPFGQLVHLERLGEYVEGTAFSADERLLYFHRKDGERDNLYAIPIR